MPRTKIDVIAKAFYKWCVHLEKLPCESAFLSAEEKDMLMRLHAHGKGVINPHKPNYQKP